MNQRTTVSFYKDHILPYLVHASMRQERLVAYRRRAASAAAGRILEIGVGSGLNFPHYGDGARLVIGLEPSAKLLSMAERPAKGLSLPVELLKASAEAIPLQDTSVDTVVTTWTLCTIPDVRRALSEMRRVLKPGGRLVFVEHGLSCDDDVCRWQNRLTPLWKLIGGGCHLNRAIGSLIEEAGFRIERMETGYMEGPRPMTFMYEGTAEKSVEDIPRQSRFSTRFSRLLHRPHGPLWLLSTGQRKRDHRQRRSRNRGPKNSHLLSNGSAAR